MSNLELFKERKLVIATMHKKEQVIAPLLENHLGVKIILPEQFNTDLFGTFTREIERTGNQLEAARKKVYAAMTITGIDLGVSSEGSFDAHPNIPFIQSNFEIILLVDKKNNYETLGQHRTTETNIDGKYVTSVEEALNFAHKIGFPEHGIILRESQNGHFNIYKNILTIDEFIEKSGTMLSNLPSQRIYLEADMRAHRNPTRMKAIEKATEDLIKNILSCCPKCNAPGFVVWDIEKGLKCAICNTPTELPLYEIYRCAICHYSEKINIIKYGTTADPRYCGYCNP